jgi:hypothetical protein
MATQYQRVSPAYGATSLAFHQIEARTPLAKYDRYQEKIRRTEDAKHGEPVRAPNRMYFGDQRCPICGSFGCDGC